MSDPVLSIAGIRLAAVNIGIKQTRRPDCCLIEACPNSSIAAVFTQNRFAAAPVQVARQHLAQNDKPRYLLINSGNANCGTGIIGIRDAEALCARIGELAGCEANAVLPFSTGVIGEHLPRDKMISGLDILVENLAPDAWSDCAHAIMTTDTRPKIFSTQFYVEDQIFNLIGIAKGAGMIRPNMATMLSFIATDANVEPTALRQALQLSVKHSFNRITIDGDTSTNDAAVIFATGTADKPRLHSEHAQWSSFQQSLDEVCTALAKAIVADGEGATKFVEILVTSRSQSMSETIGFTVAESPLVKTALFASDPNWGRILAAIGRAPVEAFDIDDVSIYLGHYQIVKNGSVIPGYMESEAAKVMAESEIKITIEIGAGAQACSIWTTDLSYDYVKINAEYRT